MALWRRIGNAIKLNPNAGSRFGFGLSSKLQCVRHESQGNCVELELKPGIDPEAVRAASFVSKPFQRLAESRRDIGYEVVGRLQVLIPMEVEDQDAFAVVQLGSKQFKVTAGDVIYVEKLKCDVNEKLKLQKVLLLGTPTETVVGRPFVPNATVSALVEEHALDAEVIIFKKKRRKNYRRTNYHRQMLTRIRITRIHGLENYADEAAPSTEQGNKAAAW